MDDFSCTDDFERERRADDSGRKREAMDSFGGATDAYLASDVHREGDDLAMLAEWCDGAARALDVACGAGHAASALASASAPADANVGASNVVAADATPEMVQTATENFDVRGVVADAERLPFADESFDAVTCRIAAHHFPDPQAFVREVCRVLDDGGVFAFEDNVAPEEGIAPEDDELADFFNRFERLRDPSHVEAYSRSQWEDWFREAGFEVEQAVVVRKGLDYESWVERTDPSADARETLDELVRTPEAEEVYGVSVENGEIDGFGNRKVLIRAQKKA